jgi:ribosomal protein S18 acetylase RimI-like enzyme
VASVRFDASDTGRRVTLRRTLPDDGGRMGDVVGILDRWVDGVLTIVTRSGERVTVAEDTLVAGKVVAPAIGSAELQERCAADWTPAEVALVNGWPLRYHYGVNRRSCSALALTPPEASWPEHLEQVRRWYGDRQAPALILTVEGSAVDTALAAARMPVDLENEVMVAQVADVVSTAPRLEHVDFRLDHTPSEHFLDVNSERAEEREHLASLLASAPAARYGTGVQGNEAVATGRVSPRGTWAGLTHLDVAEESRRQGIGSALVGALARAASEAGALHLWLQVERDNAAARAMYSSLGFTTHHGYVYRGLS